MPVSPESWVQQLGGGGTGNPRAMVGRWGGTAGGGGGRVGPHSWQPPWVSRAAGAFRVGGGGCAAPRLPPHRYIRCVGAGSPGGGPPARFMPAASRPAADGEHPETGWDGRWGVWDLGDWGGGGHRLEWEFAGRGGGQAFLQPQFPLLKLGWGGRWLCFIQIWLPRNLPGGGGGGGWAAAVSPCGGSPSHSRAGVWGVGGQQGLVVPELGGQVLGGGGKGAMVGLRGRLGGGVRVAWWGWGLGVQGGGCGCRAEGGQGGCLAPAPLPQHPPVLWHPPTAASRHGAGPVPGTHRRRGWGVKGWGHGRPSPRPYPAFRAGAAVPGRGRAGPGARSAAVTPPPFARRLERGGVRRHRRYWRWRGRRRRANRR